MDPSTSEEHQPEILQQQQIELVEYEFPPQQWSLPEPGSGENQPLDPNGEKPQNNDHLLFMDAGSLDFSRVPEDLQPKLRNEYFKILRSRDAVQIKMQAYDDENIYLRNQIQNLNRLMKEKDSQLMNLNVATQRNGDNADGEAPPLPSAVLAAINFSEERTILYQQIRDNVAQVETLKRKAIDTEAAHEQRYTLLESELDESKHQFSLLEIEKNQLKKQNLELKNEITEFNAKLGQLENSKKKEVQELNQLIAELNRKIGQREAQLAQFEKMDVERKSLAQNALRLEKTNRKELERFKTTYIKDVNTLQAKNKILSDELKTAKSYLDKANREVVEKQIEKVFPVLFASVPKDTANVFDFYHVVLVEKKKNIQLQARIAQLEKVKADLDKKLVVTLKHATDDPDDEPQIKIKEEKEDASIVVKTEPEDSEVEISAFKPNEVPSSELGDAANRALRDRYESVLSSSHRFYLANQNLKSLLDMSELNLKKVLEQNVKLNAELDEMKRIEAERNSEQLKQNQNIKTSMEELDKYIEQNSFLLSRLKERNEKLKQLEENLIQVKRENTKWFTELKQAQAKTQLAEEREISLINTTMRMEAENEDFRIHVNALQGQIEILNDELTNYSTAYDDAMIQMENQKQQFVAMHQENLERINQQYEMPQRQLLMDDEAMLNSGEENGGPNVANLNDNSLENPVDNSFNYDGQDQ